MTNRPSPIFVSEESAARLMDMKPGSDEASKAYWAVWKSLRYLWSVTYG